MTGGYIVVNMRPSIVIGFVGDICHICWDTNYERLPSVLWHC